MRGGSDLSEKENQEMIILQEYLPEQVSEQELKDRIQKVILELGIVEYEGPWQNNENRYS